MKRNLLFRSLLLGVLSIAVLLGFGRFYLTRMRQSLWEQSVSNVLEVTTQGGHAFEVYLDQGLTMLEGRANNFALYSSQDPEGIKNKLDLYEEGAPTFVAIDLDHGVLYFNSTEQMALPPEQLDHYRTLPQNGFLEPFLSEYTGQRVVGYYERFHFLDGAHGMVRKTVLLSEVSEQFSLSFYDGAGSSYVVNARGEIMLRPANEGGNRSFLNVFDVLSMERNTQEDVDALRSYMASGSRGVMRLNYGSAEHIFAFVPLSGTEGWYLLSIIPSDVIAAHADRLIIDSQLFVTVVVVAMCIFASFIFVTLQYRRWVNDQQLELLYREHLFNLLANNTNDVFLMLAADGSTVNYVSPNVERVMGTTVEAVTSDLTNLQSVIHGDGRGVDLSVVQSVPLGGSASFEGQCVHPVTGETRWYVETVFHTVVGSMERYIIVLADRTEDRQKEATLTEALEIAKVANEAKSTFLSNMSHDIRTPMNAVVGLSSLLLRDADDPEKVRDHAGKIAASSQHLLGLINDILDMSKIESGNTTLNIEPFRLSEVLDELSTIISPQARAKQQDFRISVEDVHSDALLGDRLRISQILINILSNAVKYTPEGGVITMTVRQLGQVRQSIARLRFTVEDNGIGMSQEYLEKIFQPFTRESRSVVDHIQGTGLGMPITKSLVDLMGGAITVESQLGEGSTFTVELDLRIQEDSSPVSSSPAPAVNASSGLSGRRLLCAEDNALNAQILKELLGGEGAVCDLASDGKEAVERFASAPAGTYDAILMDVQMPVMNGYDAARAIRALDHPQAAAVPIVAMTANAFADDVRDALEAGMDAHVAKPLDIPKLVRTLNQLWADKGRKE